MIIAGSIVVWSQWLQSGTSTAQRYLLKLFIFGFFCQWYSAIAEQASQFDRLSWTLDTTRIDNPPDYVPDEIIAQNEAISQSKSDFTIATAVLGALLALVLVGAVIFFVYESM